jgi:polyhydroxyalkanoate synthesis regulator phasin
LAVSSLAALAALVEHEGRLVGPWPKRILLRGMARRDAEKLISMLRRMSEEGAAAFFGEVIANDALRKALGRAGERFIDNKGRFDRSVETLLDFVNIPSKRDIRELKSRLDHLNGQLLNLNIKLDRVVSETPKASGPRRAVKKP